jgi:hypothetical protein
MTGAAPSSSSLQGEGLRQSLSIPRGPPFVLFAARRRPTTKSLRTASSVLPGGPRGIWSIVTGPARTGVLQA